MKRKQFTPEERIDLQLKAMAKTKQPTMKPETLNKTSVSEHTPWIVDVRNDEVFIECVELVDGETRAYAIAKITDDNLTAMIADAQRIVTAVNNFDEMNEFLKEIERAELYADELAAAGMVDNPHIKALRQLSKKAQELIAKATQINQ